MAASYVLMRVDAGGGHGWGHFMRCRSLAAALAAQGCSVGFLMAAPPPAVAGQVRGAGFELSALRSSAASRKDLDETLALAQNRGAGLVLDGYHFGQDYVDGLANTVFCMAIDDLMERRYNLDLVLNHNLHARPRDYQTGPGTRLLLGPEYMLLRPEFAKLHRTEKPAPPTSARRILITFGATDPNGLNPHVLESLGACTGPLQIKVMVGGASPHLNRLESLAAESRHGVEILCDHRASQEVMAWAQLSVSGSGMTGYELACLGVPMLIITPVDNQLAISQAMARRGMAWHLGWWQHVGKEEIAQAVQQLTKDQKKRSHLSRAAMAAVDGGGALRAARAFLEAMKS